MKTIEERDLSRARNMPTRGFGMAFGRVNTLQANV
jgi:hypothetical protein